MALIVGGQTVTTDEAGTNKLDATKYLEIYQRLMVQV